MAYLMTNHQAEYPQFYTKLYGLILGDEPSQTLSSTSSSVTFSSFPFSFSSSLSSSFGPRLLIQVDSYLSSPMLASSIVASFIKRLLRCSLTSPTNIILGVMAVIHNSLVRNPTLRRMIGVGRENVDIDTSNNNNNNNLLFDPYVAEEEDPLLTKAENSSLWEIGVFFFLFLFLFFFILLYLMGLL
jgi:U3 small nucleolar RNA-associated protein 19